MSSGKSTYGYIIRDHVGSIVMIGVGRLYHLASILFEEAWWMKEGVKVALSLGIKNWLLRVIT